MSAVAVLLLLSASPPAAAGADRLLDLSIEELGRIPVTSVSRRAERQAAAPAAVYVITREQIRDSGVRTIPEALRLAPGVEVARNSAHSWTISMRGFSNDLSNKLLVLIDGRSVYTPLYGGVYWDAQDTVLNDIERIEVIGGPGGTLWGANAVNGVINIITRSAWDTTGGRLALHAGNELKRQGTAQWGGRIGSDIAARGYVKRTEHDASRRTSGEAAVDDWQNDQAGFRADWRASAMDDVTVQGDIYTGERSALLRPEFTLGTLPGPSLPGTIDVRGRNLLARWTRDLGEGAELRLQGYYDYTYRRIPGTFRERRDTVDLDLFHRLRPVGRHDITWGATFRSTEDDLRNTQFATFEPDSRTDRTFGAFLQDRLDLWGQRAFLTLGAKVERNDYTGTEFQPNVRGQWEVSDRHMLWAAVSRAVRIPGRLNEDLELYAPLPGLPLPAYINVRGSDDYRSEELVAYEVGWRMAAAANLSFDLALYNHAYDRLQTTEFLGAPIVVPGPAPYLVLPFEQGNGLRGDVHGGTLNVKWQPTAGWRLDLQFTHTRLDLEPRPGSVDRNTLNLAGNTPKNQAGIQSYLELGRGVTLYTGARYVDELPNQNVSSYVAVDASLAWQVTPQLRGAVTVRDLTDPRHPEFGLGNEVERSIVLSIDWRI